VSHIAAPFGPTVFPGARDEAGWKVQPDPILSARYEVHGYLMEIVSTDASTGSPVLYRSCLCLSFQVFIQTTSSPPLPQNGAGTSVVLTAEAPGFRTGLSTERRPQHDGRTLNKLMLWSSAMA
jgi:hypothetical protein